MKAHSDSKFCVWVLHMYSTRVLNFNESVASRRQIIDRDRQHKIDLWKHKELEYTSKEHIRILGIGITPSTFAND